MTTAQPQLRSPSPVRPPEWPRGAADSPARLLRALRDEGRLELPLPGGGHTWERFERLRDFAALDLSLGRLVEGHSDARAILGEAGTHSDPKPLRGVWAADPPQAALEATSVGNGWVLRGTKHYCSGARALDRALITAQTTDGVRLFDVDLHADGVHVRPEAWAAVGMAASDSADVDFDLTLPPDAAVGPPDFYLVRRGFWQGAVGVAACWWGGAIGCERMLRARFARTTADEHAAAHFGAIVADCLAMEDVLRAAASAIDSEAKNPRPLPDAGPKERALRVRSFVEAACQRVLAATGRASGTAPLVFDAAHARRAADLVVYLRQHHAERDLAALGRLALEEGRAEDARRGGVP